MKASIVVPTYNREEELVDTIKCALAQDYENYEIVIVDQTSNHKPETLLFIEQNKQRFNYIHFEEPSLTRARNIGVRAAIGEIIIMVDDDTCFDKNFVREHVNAIQEGFDVVSGRVDEGRLKSAKHPVWFNVWGRYSGSENCLSDGPTNKLAGCNGSFRKEVFNTLNGFDENFIKVANCEDADFGYRAYRAGYSVRFKASASLIHKKAICGGVGNRENSIYLDESYYQNRFYFTKKLFPKYAMIYLRIRLIIKGLKAAYRVVRKAEKEADRRIASERLKG
jgi:glycosyltransferase involved in cell wall biosynthesis